MVTTRDRIAVDGRSFEKTLQAIGWGLFFVWIGVALIANIGWGIGLVGVSIIMLGEQMARKYFSLEPGGFLDRHWRPLSPRRGIGTVEVPVGLVPILCIVVGIALLLSPLWGSRAARGQESH
jgi:hypothetical protein